MPIEVRSAPGRGTTFRLFIPLVSAPRPSSPESTSPAIPLQPPAGTASIMIVDDEPSVREIYSDILIENGYTVRTCRDGGEAIRFFDEGGQAVDLVLLDMIMPRVNGKDTFLALRRRFPEMKVLFMSGLSDQDSIAELLREPATGFFQKPCDDEQLMEKVVSMLRS